MLDLQPNSSNTQCKVCSHTQSLSLWPNIVKKTKQKNNQHKGSNHLSFLFFFNLKQVSQWWDCVRSSSQFKNLQLCSASVLAESVSFQKSLFPGIDFLKHYMFKNKTLRRRLYCVKNVKFDFFFLFFFALIGFSLFSTKSQPNIKNVFQENIKNIYKLKSNLELRQLITF